MGDKRPLLFPLLLFAIFFFLIAVTGSFQIVIIKRNIEGLLLGEGEILFSSIQREMDINVEYLNLLEKSPSIMTPNLFNVLAYDEAIVEDLYNQLSGRTIKDLTSAPLNNMLVYDTSGKEVLRKGSVTVPKAYYRELVAGNKATVIKMPSYEEQTLFMGLRTTDAVLFFTISDPDLETLRKKYIVRTILENEGKRLNIAAITIYDEKGQLFLRSGEKKGNVFNLTRPLDSKYFPHYTMEILVSRQPASDTFRRTTVSFLGLLFFLIAGGAVGIYVISLLERKHRERLREIEKEMAVKERLVSLGRLASGMAHEIRNPLNAISMSVQRLRREFTPEEEKEEEYYRFIDIVRSELSRVNSLVEEFLLATKAQIPFQDEKTHAIVEEVALILREKAESKGIEITNRVDETAVVNCQKERLKQAFHNLLLNAIEAMDQKKGLISVSSEVHDGKMHIHIKDTGPGMKKENLVRIFEYYYTTKDKGIGIGLPLSYMIVKEHGGDIQAASDEGVGATFTVTLPLAK